MVSREALASPQEPRISLFGEFSDVLPPRERCIGVELDPEIHLQAWFEDIFQRKRENDESYERIRHKFSGIFLQLSQAHNLLKISSTIKDVAAVMYAYRGTYDIVSQLDNFENKDETTRASLYIVKPGIERLKECYTTIKSQTELFAKSLIKISENVFQDDSEVSEIVISAICEVFVSLLLTDEIKRVNVSILNDLTAYKRFTRSLQSDINQEESNEEMTLFLSTLNFTVTYVENLLMQIPNIERIIICAIDYCIRCESNTSLTFLNLKSVHICALFYALNLLNALNVENINHKTLKIQQIKKIILNNPVIPLFGDAVLETQDYFSKLTLLRSLLHSSDQRSLKEQQNIDKSYNLLSFMNEIMEEALKFYTKFGLFIQPILESGLGENPPDNLIRCIFLFYKDCANFLVSVSTKLARFISWKQCNPKKNYNAEFNTSASSYEMAFSLNLNDAENFAILECMMVIKDISSITMTYREPAMNSALKFLVFDVTSKFKNTIIPIIDKWADKKNDNDIKCILRIISATLNSEKKGPASPPPSPKPVNSPDEMLSPEEKADSKNSLDLSYSKIQLAAILARIFILKKARSSNKFNSLMKESKKANVSYCFDDFYNFSDNLYSLSSIDRIIMDAIDMSYMWFREVHLSMDRKEKFQLSISLPWLLSECIIKNNSPSLKKYILLPFYIYSDAENKALRTIKSQSLCDEVREEVKECFKCMISAIGNMLYTICVKREHNMCAPDGCFDSQVTRKDLNFIDSVMDFSKENDYIIFGRHIDAGLVMSKCLENILRERLYDIITQVECEGLKYLALYELALKIVERVYNYFADNLPMEPYHKILNQTNGGVNGESGRLRDAILDTITKSIIPYFRYNSQIESFLAPFLTMKYCEPLDDSENHPPLSLPELENMSHVYASKFGTFMNIFPPLCSDIIYRICGPLGLMYIADRIKSLVIECLTELANKCLVPIQQVISSLPKAPLVEYGCYASYRYYEAHFANINSVVNIEDDAIPLLRRIGNATAFLKQLDIPLEKFQISKKIYLRELDDNESTFMKEIKLSINNIVSTEEERDYYNTIISKVLAEPQEDEVSVLGSYLEAITDELKEMSEQICPKSTDPSANNMCNIWSILQFSVCSFVSAKLIDIEDEFGEFISWAGCALVSATRQRSIFNETDVIYRILNSEALTEGLGSKKRLETAVSTVNSLNDSLNSTGAVGQEMSKIAAKREDNFQSFIKNAKYIKQVNNTVFDILSCHQIPNDYY